MIWKATELRYRPNPALERALDVLFILHADHEQNCSAHAMRTVGSSHADPYSATAAAAAGLYGPLHGGANEEVLRMLREIGSVGNIARYLRRVRSGEIRLMGFGHRVYKNYDPRAKLIKQVADEVFDVTGRNPLLDIALELERIALEYEYFVSHKLYPNVDFYSGIIYQAMRFPADMFPVLFAIGRTPGWLAQWEEGLLDPEQKITRPRQIYVGQGLRLRATPGARLTDVERAGGSPPARSASSPPERTQHGPRATLVPHLGSVPLGPPAWAGPEDIRWCLAWIAPRSLAGFDMDQSRATIMRSGPVPVTAASGAGAGWSATTVRSGPVPVIGPW